MKISIMNGVDPYKLQGEIERRIADRFVVSTDSTQGFVTRPGFTIEHNPNGKKYTAFLHVCAIRLQEKKDYCGNHPNSCEFNVFGGRGRKAVFLEGLDWVDFNDRINDACDALHVEAKIETGVCVLRKGFERRINYGSHIQGNFYQWDRVGYDEDYENWCGEEAPESTYPYGTPGTYERKVNA